MAKPGPLGSMDYIGLLLRLKKSARLPLAREATKRDGLQFAMTRHKSLFFIIKVYFYTIFLPNLINVVLNLFPTFIVLVTALPNTPNTIEKMPSDGAKCVLNSAFGVTTAILVETASAGCCGL